MELRLAAHNWMRPEPLEVTLERLARYGYEGIEIMGEPDKYEPKETRRLLEKHGVRCWGAVSIMLQCRDLIHADHYLRLGSIEYLKDCITMVHELGGEVMCIVPSEVGKITPMADPETEWGWAVESLKQVADHARKQNVRIALEPLNRFETNFLNRHDQALCLADAVGEDVGVCLDAFHINIEEADPYEAIRAVGSRLTDFHIADTNRRAPGEGAWDWKKLLKTLDEINYTGCLTTEFVNPSDRSPLGGDRRDAGTEGSAEELKFIRDHGSDLQDNETYSASFEQTAEYLKSCMPQAAS
ncbi:MAG: sugar phosphate isomerase/epimerase [Phycisphaerales bacterium]|nr:epimerase [Phycisphaerae bacterium]MCH2153055.1 sugar phosphate isomerase/epimerase [Phycisphaerales bacterium]|tara:strand:+ start:889 stop:1785 length:897 start_codon:yes stop_codon:yes gene_type:complete